MPERGYKRPAGAAASAPTPKKQQVDDPRVAQCRVVSEVLMKAETYPESVRLMLQDMIIPAMHTAKEERNGFQATIVDMVDEVLQSIQSQTQAAIAELQGKVDGCDADKLSRQEALVSAEQSILALKDATIKQEACLKGESSSLTNAKKELAKVQKDQLAGDRRFQDAEQKKGKLEKAQATLQEFTTDKAADKPALKVLDSLEKDFGFDSGLIKVLPLVLTKEPASRSGFDLVALEQLEAAITKELADLATILEEDAPGKAERDAAVAAAWTACEEATTRHDAAREAHVAAEKSEQDGEKELTAAREAVANFFPDYKALMDDYDDKKAWLDKLVKGPLTAFKELKDGPIDAQCTEDGL